MLSLINFFCWGVVSIKFLLGGEGGGRGGSCGDICRVELIPGFSVRVNVTRISLGDIGHLTPED